MDITHVLAEEVRALVRERHIDPRADAEAVRRAAAEVVEAHERRSLTGSVRALDDPESTVGRLVTELSGFGPLQAFLDDPDVEEIWINEPALVG